MKQRPQQVPTNGAGGLRFPLSPEAFADAARRLVNPPPLAPQRWSAAVPTWSAITLTLVAMGWLVMFGAGPAVP